MDYIQLVIDFILHIDQHMIQLVQDYHLWTYAILFVIIFCETGLVVTPFLPGDSLLFVAGAITAQPDMPLEIGYLVLIVFAAAVLGDSCNYMIGHFFGKSCSPIRTQRYSSRVILTKPTLISGSTEARQSYLRVLFR